MTSSQMLGSLYPHCPLAATAFHPDMRDIIPVSMFLETRTVDILSVDSVFR